MSATTTLERVKRDSKGWVVETAWALSTEPVAIVATNRVIFIQAPGADGAEEGAVTYDRAGGYFVGAHGVEYHIEQAFESKREVSLTPPKPEACWIDSQWWVEKRGKRVALGWELPASPTKGEPS